ncbi:hypothetical protein PbDSM24746_21380 [Paenibacillus macerans]|nr:hypothetical protein PbDSM24746_21380 [Paenibacillus macerans]GBK68443.1 hypothetical protein PbJCM17693_21510 [Paenibacillus macerans]
MFMSPFLTARFNGVYAESVCAFRSAPSFNIQSTMFMSRSFTADNNNRSFGMSLMIITTAIQQASKDNMIFINSLTGYLPFNA